MARDCPQCDGLTVLITECPECHGQQDRHPGPPCPRCNGQGGIEVDCPECRGTGRIYEY